MSDLFKVLGVERNCTTQDVRKAFMTQALIWHPDRAPEEKKDEYTKQYELLQEAYKTLSNEQHQTKSNISRIFPSDEPQPPPQSNFKIPGTFRFDWEKMKLVQTTI